MTGKKSMDTAKKRLTILCMITIIVAVICTATNHVMLAYAIAAVCAAYFLIRERKRLTGKMVICGGILTSICILYRVDFALTVFPCYLCGAALLENQKETIYFYSNRQKHTMRNTLVCIFGIGGILSILNVLMMLGSVQEINLSFHVDKLFHAFFAGISEEIVFRLFLFSLSVYLIQDCEMTSEMNRLCYIIIVIPHVILHFTQGFNLFGFICLSVFFGMPFAMMQRKLNLVSAIGAHTLVDLVRFIVIGH